MTEPNELAPVEATPLAVQDDGGALVPATEFGSLLALAKQGVPQEVLERMVTLAERLEDRKAVRQFSEAFAAFTAEKAVIPHNKRVKFASKSGTKVNYSYASLAQLDRILTPKLHKNGLSVSYDCKVEPQGVTITCTLEHVGGHRKPASVTLPMHGDERMTQIQRIGSTITSGRRMTFAMVTGCTDAETDTDCRPYQDEIAPADAPKITDAQAREIDDLIDSDAQKGRVLKTMKVAMISDIPASRFEEVIRRLSVTIQKPEPQE